MNKNLVYNKFSQIKSDNCFGCIYQLESLKDHNCYQTEFDDFYYSEALDQLLREELITIDQYKPLYEYFVTKQEQEPQQI
jgi:hypothetical protein